MYTTINFFSYNPLLWYLHTSNHAHKHTHIHIVCMYMGTYTHTLPWPTPSHYHLPLWPLFSQLFNQPHTLSPTTTIPTPTQYESANTQRTHNHLTTHSATSHSMSRPTCRENSSDTIAKKLKSKKTEIFRISMSWKMRMWCCKRKTSTFDKLRLFLLEFSIKNQYIRHTQVNSPWIQ